MGDKPLQEYVTKGIFYPVFNGDIVRKIPLERVGRSNNFISSGAK